MVGRVLDAHRPLRLPSPAGRMAARCVALLLLVLAAATTCAAAHADRWVGP